MRQTIRKQPKATRQQDPLPGSQGLRYTSTTKAAACAITSLFPLEGEPAPNWWTAGESNPGPEGPVLRWSRRPQPVESQRPPERGVGRRARVGYFHNTGERLDVSPVLVVRNAPGPSRSWGVVASSHLRQRRVVLPVVVSNFPALPQREEDVTDAAPWIRRVSLHVGHDGLHNLRVCQT